MLGFACNASAMQQAPPPTFGSHAISLFLDFDGTLVDLAEHPEAVIVGDALKALLTELAGRLGGRVALVSGRSVDQIDRLVGPAAHSLAVVGSHGGEVRAAGAIVLRPERPPMLGNAERAFNQAFLDREGVIIEVKSLGVAIHYRQNPSFAAEANALAERFGAESGLMVQKGKMMVELRSAGHDKGSGIAALMQSPPFAGHVPIFLGDDVTDEPGFELCAALGGAGILVGPDRETAAQYRLTSVADVHHWLRAL
ncbi:MAG: trehalose-phosphatase [Novosphingobium sp.]